MAWTQSDLDKLDKAIGSGRLRVQYSDSVVEYRSLDDMLRVRSMMVGKLGNKGKTRVSPRYSKDVE